MFLIKSDWFLSQLSEYGVPTVKTSDQTKSSCPIYCFFLLL